MATLIVRPISNVLKSWNTSDYTYIDDDVTNPTKSGTGDYNSANKNDSNEVEWYGCTTVAHSVVSAITVNLLASAYSSGAGNLTLTGNYMIGASTGVAKSFTVPLQTVNNPPLVADYAWYSGTWTGLSLPMSGNCRIGIGVGAMVQPQVMFVAVGYLFITYTIGSYVSIIGGTIQGGTII